MARMQQVAAQDGESTDCRAEKDARRAGGEEINNGLSVVS